MNTRSRTDAKAGMRAGHSVTVSGTKTVGDAPSTDAAFDLAGAAYRVVLGCCTKEETIITTDHGRRVPAKAATTVRKKEVIS